MNQVYSKIDSIPVCDAPDTLTAGTLCLEGGAFRGTYTSGVLDTLMLEGINLKTTVGVSAGALNGLNYVAGNVGRSANCNLRYRHDSRWVGVRALRSDHGLIGFRFAFEEFPLPLNEERLFRGDRRLIVVAANLLTGEAEYFDNSDRDKLFAATAASASMPYASRPVRIDGVPYLDGGCATKLPVRYAIESGMEKIVFIATREAGYRRKNKVLTRLDKLYFRRYPAFLETFARSSDRYNEDSDQIDLLAERGEIFRIAPSQTVTVSRLEGDMEKLGALYELGVQDAKSALPALRAYLGL
ncbi:MAG: patatin family protein [Christensenellaceae bacterium]